ncbi:hypothetical protein J3Q64DRAFT_1421919 [Phycomyces blakesleeanus]|uniref:Uncharacterized protein n=2 Tax=Phycomyces blakesleeanus TaxID=4837 RepID=A0A163DAK0_PHYB8|nr:hypothetical protein PHYBLDRAFT_149147 [Phycomyces blakesleeanus NRRL 1555(-)]OAD69980.1 hypothetical protein PHYBLDRAFT_149147 [Phycomyces blakesleeanus NRRL 1555(-)]|eukprot:XP_018288020.1 hypothetical protein PHYBLDRAFT_149147 [Phycomyces blakesleeanus NRRL 1555(-)]
MSTINRENARSPSPGTISHKITLVKDTLDSKSHVSPMNPKDKLSGQDTQHRSPLRDIYKDPLEFPRRSPSENGLGMVAYQENQIAPQTFKAHSPVSEEGERERERGVRLVVPPKPEQVNALPESKVSDQHMAQLRHKVYLVRQKREKGEECLRAEKKETRRLQEEVELMEEEIEEVENEIKDVQLSFESIPGYLELKEKVDITAQEAAETYQTVEEVKGMVEEMLASDEYHQTLQRQQTIDHLMNCITECMYEIQVLNPSAIA